MLHLFSWQIQWECGSVLLRLRAKHVQQRGRGGLLRAGLLERRGQHQLLRVLRGHIQRYTRGNQLVAVLTVCGGQLFGLGGIRLCCLRQWLVFQRGRKGLLRAGQLERWGQPPLHLVCHRQVLWHAGGNQLVAVRLVRGGQLFGSRRVCLHPLRPRLVFQRGRGGVLRAGQLECRGQPLLQRVRCGVLFEHSGGS